MKQLNFWFILTVMPTIAVSASQWSNTENTLKNTTTEQKRLTDTLKLEDIVLHTERNGIMYFNISITEKLSGFTSDSIFINYGYLFDIGKHNELRHNVQNYYYDNKGNFVTIDYYNLYHKSFHGVQNWAYCKSLNHVVTECKLMQYTKSFDADTTFIVTKEEAIDSAIAYYRKFMKYKSNDFLWESWFPSTFEYYYPEVKDFKAACRPQVLYTCVYDNNGKDVFTYCVSITFFPSMKSVHIWVDTQNGEVINKVHKAWNTNPYFISNTEKSYSSTEYLSLDEISFYSSNSGDIYFRNDVINEIASFTGNGLILNHGYLFDIGKDNELRLKEVKTNDYHDGKMTRYQYALYHKGYLIHNWAATYEDWERRDDEFSFRKYHLDIDTTLNITAEEAKNIVLSALSKDIVVYNINSNLEANNKLGDYKLYFVVSLLSYSPTFDSREILIDPKSGEIRANYSTINY